jgi:predicted secreted protein
MTLARETQRRDDSHKKELSMRIKTIRLGSILAGIMLLATALPTTAQTPGGGQGPGAGAFRGGAPSGGGVGLMVVSQDQDRDQLLLQLRLQDCEPRMLAVTADGGWRMFIPGAPEFVNRDFPGRLRAGEPFLVDCVMDRPVVRLTAADDHKAVTLQAGNRLHVVLESNASTGYSWVVTPVPDAGVLATIGEPFYVPSASTLLGASGHQVFDFRAVGAGTITLHLTYQRTTSTPDALGAEWSVSITVQP